MTTTPDAEPHLAKENASMATTHWTVVLEAARQDSATGQTALAVLCQTYWYPVYAFIRRGGRSAEDAEDLTQAFFERLVEKNWLQSVTREGGKFRSTGKYASAIVRGTDWTVSDDCSRRPASSTVTVREGSVVVRDRVRWIGRRIQAGQSLRISSRRIARRR